MPQTYTSGDSVDELLELARDVRENGYGPWSVDSDEEPRRDGAVLVTEDGAAYVGCNVENVNYTNTTGALTNAFAAMIQDEFPVIDYLAVSTDAADRYVFSGEEMQVVSEFAASDTPVIVDEDGDVDTHRLGDILNPFDDERGLPSPSVDVGPFDPEQLYDSVRDTEDAVDAARDARKHAYTPVSGYGVGVAAVTDDGTVFEGYNVENADIGVTVHGEQNALHQMVAHGYGRGDLDTVVVSSPGEEPFPCGLCRQTIAEFADDDTTIIADGIDDRSEADMAELYPAAFDPDSL